MKKVFSTILVFLLLCSASFAGSIARDTARHDSLFIRDGSSFEKAIIITETNEEAGDAAEYKWLSEHYPGYLMGSQTLAEHEKRPYDILSFKTAAGVSKEIYFDISNFFGKW
jgi:hypothetical protein